MVPKESNVASVRSGNRFRETGRLSGKPAAFPGNRPPFREIGHPSGNPVSSGRFPAGLGGRFAPESVAGFLWNHRPVSSGIRTEGLSRVFFVSGGSEATESALKMARKYQHRNR